jgi:hypothetical protein
MLLRKSSVAFSKRWPGFASISNWPRNWLRFRGTPTTQGEMPVERIASRIIGVTIASGEYADIGSSVWISRLRITLMVE